MQRVAGGLVSMPMVIITKAVIIVTTVHVLGAFLSPLCVSSYFILTVALWGGGCYPFFRDAESNLKEVKSYVLDHVSSKASESGCEPGAACS